MNTDTIPAEVLDRYRRAPSKIRILLYLLDRREPGALAVIVSNGELEDAIGSTRRSVQRHLAELETDGTIVRTPGHWSDGGRPLSLAWWSEEGTPEQISAQGGRAPQPGGARAPATPTEQISAQGGRALQPGGARASTRGGARLNQGGRPSLPPQKKPSLACARDSHSSIELNSTINDNVNVSRTEDGKTATNAKAPQRSPLAGGRAAVNARIQSLIEAQQSEMALTAEIETARELGAGASARQPVQPPPPRPINPPPRPKHASERTPDGPLLTSTLLDRMASPARSHDDALTLALRLAEDFDDFGSLAFFKRACDQVVAGERLYRDLAESYGHARARGVKHRGKMFAHWWTKGSKQSKTNPRKEARR